MIEYYKSIQDIVSDLSTYSGKCRDAINEAEIWIKDNVINGEPIDKGKLANFKERLTKAEGVFSAINVECSQRIAEESYGSDNNG